MSSIGVFLTQDEEVLLKVWIFEQLPHRAARIRCHSAKSVSALRRTVSVQQTRNAIRRVYHLFVVTHRPRRSRQQQRSNDHASCPTHHVPPALGILRAITGRL